MSKRLSILVTGRVQGVMFRQSVKNFADKLKIVGFAENLLDGKVKIVAEGKEEDLKKLLEFSYSGSLMAKVESVFFDWSESLDEFSDFKIKREKNNLVSDQIYALTNLGKKIFSRDTDIDINNLDLPKHLVIIPDGNRRWAKLRGLPTLIGHQKGSEKIKEILQFLQNSKIESITIWLFSTENWKRNEEEVKGLMKIFDNSMGDISRICMENKVVFNHLGRKNFLNKNLSDFLENLERETKSFSNIENFKSINLAIDYGGRDEIIRAINSIPDHENITQDNFNNYLDTKNIRDPDLIIRTSGEQRLSGILPWQSVYSELYFSPKHFPDFDIYQLKLALLDYSERKRRYGQ